MKFQPKSEQELQAMNLIDPGTYQFEVVTATDKISKKGNEMIEVQLKIWDINGHEHIVYDYLLESMAYKLKHFADVCGLGDKYLAGELGSLDCVGRGGKVELIIQDGQPKPDGGLYPAKNAVKDYVLKGSGNTKPAVIDEPFVDDDLPF